MNLEKLFEQKRFGEGRKKLLELEREGRYVFHGSPSILTTLSPMQAEGENMATGEMEKDGNPAVCASDLADQAIFRALVNEKRGHGNSSARFGTDNSDKLHFWATQDLIDIAKNSTGIIYVFEKDQFNHFEGHEWRTGISAAPKDIIEVTFEDLPKDIEIVG